MRRMQLTIEKKISIIAKEIYGAGKVEFSDEAKEKIKRYTKQVR